MRQEQLAHALGELEQDGTLDAAQRRAVEERLLEALFPRKERTGLLVAVISVLGSLLIGAGVLFFVAQHWDELGKWAQIGLVLAALLLSHHFGFVLAEQPGRYPRTGTALTLLGVLCLGGALILVTQIYNMQSVYESNLVLAWWLCAVPFVFLRRSPALLLVVTALFTIWLAWHTCLWLDVLDLDSDENAVSALCLLGLGFAALMTVLASLCDNTRFAGFAPVFRLFAALAGFLGLYGLSFHDGAVADHAPGAPWAVTLPFALVAGLALFLVLWAARGKASRPGAFDAALLIGIGAVLVAAIRLWPACVFVLANLVLLFGLLALIARGANRGVPAYINLGIAGFLVLVMTRYFEYLADRMDNAFLAFIGAGALLLGLGLWLERKRRALLTRVRERSS
ncbi:MAG: DUF2157 domain-containing protein [Planctomycetes bacterium]|nr:DUF2157 domain-containing protein [Planctomycetota bacterium]